MTTLELAPKQKRAKGEVCCEPVVYPDIEREQAERMGEVAKALGDPVRMQLVDVLESTPARSASASWCRSSTSRSPPSPITSRSCATPASSAPSARASGPTTTSSPMHWRS